MVGTLVGGLLSSRSGGIPGDEEADNVVDPPLEDLEESPLGPPGVKPRSNRRGDGGDIIGVADVVALLVDGVLTDDVIKVKVVVRFFWAFNGTLQRKTHSRIIFIAHQTIFQLTLRSHAYAKC